MARDDRTLPDGHVTADDVATEAGVSRWTVNRAFRKDASISARSREKVMEAATRLGYVPDMRAASLASDRSNLVALLVDDFCNPHKLVVLEHLTRSLRRAGWDTLLVNTLDEADAGPALLNASQRRVDAVILIGVQFDEEALQTAIAARRFRKLIVFARFSRNPDTINIAVDDVAAMTELAEYVAARGYRRPVFLAGPRTSSAYLDRKETFLAFWQESFGTEPPCTSVAAYSPALATEAVTTALSGRGPADLPDVIVCENDALAIGAMDAIRHTLGLRVPEDIAVTGFDDAPQARSVAYRITSFTQPVAEMADYLVEVLDSSEDRDFSRLFLGQLKPRDSA
jgi:DNA-binding LacI/PurR family transcriptional regulator